MLKIKFNLLLFLNECVIIFGKLYFTMWRLYYNQTPYFFLKYI